jgi:plastocyanin
MQKPKTDLGGEMRARRVLEQRGVVAAVVAVAGTAAVGVAGAAGSSGAAAPATVYVSETNGNCFTTSSSKPDCAGQRGDVAIETGDTVTWNFDGSGVAHNAAAANDVPADPAWGTYAGQFVTSGAYDRRFTQPGTYEYVCQAHGGMSGTITVTGDPIETTTATPSPTVTTTPTPQPSDPGTNTPPPTGGAQDLVKPTLRSIGAKGKRRAVTVTFRLSENATVTIRVKRGRKVVKSVTKQIAAGKRTVSVRSSKLKKGRYKVEVRARDASGNVSTLASKSLRIKK